MYVAMQHPFNFLSSSITSIQSNHEDLKNRKSGLIGYVHETISYVAV